MISAALLARLDARAAARRDHEQRTIAERFVDERARMLPLPAAPFRAAAVHHPRVWRRSLVRVDGALYSVWCEWAGLDVRVFAGADTIEIVGPDDRHVVQPRVRAGAKQVDYRRYLPELRKQSQAVRQIADELIRDLGEPYATLWRHLVDEHGPKEAARRFARVLDTIVKHGEAVVTERVRAALATGEPCCSRFIRQRRCRRGSPTRRCRPRCRVTRSSRVECSSSGRSAPARCTSRSHSVSRQRRRVWFSAPMTSLHGLVEARDVKELGRYQWRVECVDLLVVDELGFVPFDRSGGELLFNALAQRQGRRSVLITSNLAFGERPRVFGGEPLLCRTQSAACSTAAILDTRRPASYSRGRHDMGRLAPG